MNRREFLKHIAPEVVTFPAASASWGTIHGAVVDDQYISFDGKPPPLYLQNLKRNGVTR